jgi:hypothetical protein
MEEENIKIDLREVGCGSVDWIDMAQDWEQWRALVNMIMNRLECNFMILYHILKIEN